MLFFSEHEHGYGASMTQYLPALCVGPQVCNDLKGVDWLRSMFGNVQIHQPSSIIGMFAVRYLMQLVTLRKIGYKHYHITHLYLAIYSEL